MRISKPSVPSHGARACGAGMAVAGAAGIAGMRPCSPHPRPPTAPGRPSWRWPASDALLLGEQHDAPEHQRWEADSVRWLAERGRLAALVIEMAEAGTGTDGLPPDANAAQVYAALRWNEAAWPGRATARWSWPPWRRACRCAAATCPQQSHARRHAGRGAGQTPATRRRWRCSATPSRKATAACCPPTASCPWCAYSWRATRAWPRWCNRRQDGRTVLLAAGWGHVRRDLGVPTWLPGKLQRKVAIAQAGQARAAIESEANYIHPTPALAPRDHCAELRARPPGRLPAAK